MRKSESLRRGQRGGNRAALKCFAAAEASPFRAKGDINESNTI
jgi:hypothetical protein